MSKMLFFRDIIVPLFLSRVRNAHPYTSNHECNRLRQG